MSKVYIVQEPVKYTNAEGEAMYKINISAAAKYGDLIFVLSHGELRDYDWPANINLIKKRLELFTEQDHLVMLGNPTAMAIAALVASANVAELQVLYWLRAEQDYQKVILKTVELQNGGNQND